MSKIFERIIIGSLLVLLIPLLPRAISFDTFVPYANFTIGPAEENNIIRSIFAAIIILSAVVAVIMSSLARSYSNLKVDLDEFGSQAVRLQKISQDLNKAIPNLEDTKARLNSRVKSFRSLEDYRILTIEFLKEYDDTQIREAIYAITSYFDPKRSSTTSDPGREVIMERVIELLFRHKQVMKLLVVLPHDLSEVDAVSNARENLVAELEFRNRCARSFVEKNPKTKRTNFVEVKFTHTRHRDRLLVGKHTFNYTTGNKNDEFLRQGYMIEHENAISIERENFETAWNHADSDPTDIGVSIVELQDKLEFVTIIN